MNAGGNEYSRPHINPIFFMADSSRLLPVVHGSRFQVVSGRLAVRRRQAVRLSAVRPFGVTA
jgi:hypothetical protein